MKISKNKSTNLGSKQIDTSGEAQTLIEVIEVSTCCVYNNESAKQTCKSFYNTVTDDGKCKVSAECLNGDGFYHPSSITVDCLDYRISLVNCNGILNTGSCP